MTTNRFVSGTLVLACAAMLAGSDVRVAHAHNDKGEKHEGGEKHHEDEKLTLEQLPAPVRKTAEKEAAGAKILEVERERDGKSGKPYYEVEFKKGQDVVEVKIAEDGSVISREIERD